jgi:hypothetical protein
VELLFDGNNVVIRGRSNYNGAVRERRESVARYSDEFGAAVRDVLGKRSNREVSRLTGGDVSHTLINEIRSNGYVPNVEVIVSIARAVGADPNALLDAAGKPKYFRYVATTDDAASVRRGRMVDLRPGAVRPLAAA